MTKIEISNKIQWKEIYSVGIPKIDKQHKKLVELINIMQMAISTGGSSDIISKTISELVDYTKYHFKDEEKLMEINDYPDIKGHIIIHKRLIEKVYNMTTKYMETQLENKDENLKLSIDILNFLMKWLIDHIIGIDKKYVPYIENMDKGL